MDSHPGIMNHFQMPEVPLDTGTTRLGEEFTDCCGCKLRRFSAYAKTMCKLNAAPSGHVVRCGGQEAADNMKSGLKMAVGGCPKKGFWKEIAQGAR